MSRQINRSSFLAGSWASGVTGHGGGESIQGIGKAVGGDEIGVKDLVPGQPIGGLQCAKCNALMVPRRNRSNANWFFSCEETFKRGCDFSCMHSKAWREAYSRSLPEGFCCEPTDKTKVFHFADGSSTGSNVAVWSIPIFLQNHPGTVFSAEIPTGTTPLLLSISSLVALDAVIFMRRRVMQLKEMELEIPLLNTRT